jgi:hypothetical protein
MKTFYCATTDKPYIEEFFTEHNIMSSFRELDYGYEITLSDEDHFILELHGGWNAVIDHTLMGRKNIDLIRSTVPRGVRTK